MPKSEIKQYQEFVRLVARMSPEEVKAMTALLEDVLSGRLPFADAISLLEAATPYPQSLDS
jgi:hypothetical protein